MQVATAWRLFAASCVLCTFGCGGDEVADAADAVSAAGPGFGQPCSDDGLCAQGLVCLVGDWTSRPWCGQVCDTPGDYCDTAKTGGVASLCVEVPDDFQGDERVFCVPTCENVNQCAQLSTEWQKCERPAWKNKTLYDDLPTKACANPGAQGQVVIDPVECDWQGKLTHPKYVPVTQVCKAYCTFLKTCQYWDSAKEKIECCQWRCIQEMTPGGQVDDAVEDSKKCYVTAFTNAQGTPKVCTLHEQQCDPLADPHAP